jgi:hypothetical protein
MHDAYNHALGTPHTYEEACRVLWEPIKRFVPKVKQ